MLFWAAVAAGVWLLLALVSLALTFSSISRAAREGRVSLEEASRAILRRDAAVAKLEFSTARDLFDDADRRLRSPLALPLRTLPIGSTNVAVARSLARIGTSVADAGTAAADAIQALPEGVLELRDGRLDLGLVRRAHAAMRPAFAEIPRIDRAIADMPTGWVGGPLAPARTQARDVLPSILDGVRKAEAALAGFPSLLAEDGTKRYLVAFSNLSELRGAGGLFGFVTALEANDGDLDLHDLSGRPTEIFPPPREVGLDFPEWFPDDLRTQAGIFQNINMTTDFPTVGSFALRTAESRLPLDGVIAVDPVGIAAVLGLTGPIRVPSWPSDITAGNVAQIAMHDVYVRISDNEAREKFFEQLVRTAFGRLVSTSIRLEPSTIGTFDAIVQAGHFRMYSEHAQDQETFERLGIDGAVDRAKDATDVLSVVSENAGGNKIDWFLRRDIRYEVELDPDAGTATGRVEVDLRNTAPATGLPDYIIGSVLPELPKGTNRQIVMLIRSPRDNLETLTIEGAEKDAAAEREGTLRAYRSATDVGARSRSRLVGTFRQNVALAETQAYRLHVLRQPVPRPDFAEIEVRVPKGWRAVGQTRFLGDLTKDVVLDIRLERTVRGSIVERVFSDPVRAARRFFARLF